MPLKLGVGLICMAYLIYGMWCMVAMFNSTVSSGTMHAASVHLQLGGYNPHFFRLSTIVGIIGIFTSFFGFLGVYDDKPSWVRMFFHYMQINLLCDIIVFAADMWTLSYCDKWASMPGDEKDTNTALLELSSHKMCHWGRISYALGFGITFVIELYMLYNVWKYLSQLELNPPYPIDFGYEKFDSTARWKFYSVQEPEEIPMYTKQADYEAAQDDNSFQDQYGPDGVKTKPSYAPDGMRGPAYIRAMRQ